MNLFLNPEYRTKPLILSIDDDPDQLKGLEDALRDDDNYEIITSESPVVGVELAKEYQPSLIVLDIMMPMYDGGDVERMIHQCPATRNLPIILRSSLISHEELNEDGYLISGGEIMTSKAAPYSVLLGLIKRVLDGEDLLSLAA